MKTIEAMIEMGQKIMTICKIVDSASSDEDVGRQVYAAILAYNPCNGENPKNDCDKDQDFFKDFGKKAKSFCEFLETVCGHHTDLPDPYRVMPFLLGVMASTSPTPLSPATVFNKCTFHYSPFYSGSVDVETELTVDE